MTQPSPISIGPKLLGRRSSSTMGGFFQRHSVPLLLLLPFLALFSIFVLFPMFRSLYLSFTDYNVASAEHWIGFQNYLELFKDPRFFKALSNTTVYMISVSLISTTLGLLLAVAFGSQKLIDQFLRAIFFLPAVAGGVGIIAVWKVILSSEDFGLVNAVRKVLGFDAIRFFGDPHWAVPILIIIGVWSAMGYAMIVFVAGLRSISSELYEAAALDGATPTRSFFSITLPLMRPIIMYVLIGSMIGSFQLFYEPYVLFGTVSSVGGILDSGLTLVTFLYEKGFHRLEMGFASAIAWVLVAILLVLTLINLQVGRNSETN